MTRYPEYSEQWAAEYLERFNRGKAKAKTGAAVPAADAQPAKRARAKGPDKGEAIHPKYRIHVHSRRRRLTDSDGISAKAAIDGLVAGGLLPDDSPKWVESVTYSQEKADQDETVIEVWEILSK